VLHVRKTASNRDTKVIFIFGIATSVGGRGRRRGRILRRVFVYQADYQVVLPDGRMQILNAVLAVTTLRVGAGGIQLVESRLPYDIRHDGSIPFRLDNGVYACHRRSVGVAFARHLSASGHQNGGDNGDNRKQHRKKNP